MNIVEEKTNEIVTGNLFEDKNVDLSFSGVADELLEAAFNTDTSERYTICFVCTGNTCRSPMAAAMFNHMIKNSIIKKIIPKINKSHFSDIDSAHVTTDTEEKENIDCTSAIKRHPESSKHENNLEIKAISAGIMPNVGEKISDGAVNALMTAGIESSPDNQWKNHTAVALNRTIMEKCNLIVGISSHHAMAVLSMYPEYACKIISMPKDINDPYGGSNEEYMKCLSEITDGLKELFA